MASDMNRVMLIGRLTRDPELKRIPSGTPIANFSLANNRTYTTGTGEKKEETSFFNCIAWGKQGEIIVEYCRKGKRIAIEGRLQQRSWDDQDGKKKSTVEIVVDNFQFLDAKGDTSSPSGSESFGGGSSQGSGSYNPGPTPFNDSHGIDDDIPF